MNAREQRIPGADHPIAVTPSTDHIVVRAAGRIIADTRASLTLKEASYPAVHYIPRKDVDMSLLVRSEHTSYCPYKGDCSYFSIPVGGEKSVNAVWTYESAYPAVAAIDGHVAFYPDRIDTLDIEPEG